MFMNLEYVDLQNNFNWLVKWLQPDVKSDLSENIESPEMNVNNK